jgi:hypothetical protein
LAHDAIKFVDAIRAAGIAQLMAKAETECLNQNGRLARQNADNALKIMLEFLKNGNRKGQCKKNGTGCKQGGNSFMKMCNGNCNSGSSGNCNGIAKTLEEMLQALMQKSGQGSGSGASVGRFGSGLGGNGSGFTAPGQSQLNVPLYGPPRTSYQKYSRGTGRGNGSSAGTAIAVRIDAHSQEQLNTSHDNKADSKSMLIEELPVKYRQPIKEYFSE